jgi:O-antigen/teichoic acid export membrane protein
LVKIRFRFDKNIWLEIYKKAWPLAITIAFNLIYLRADTLILSLVKTQAEVGIYGAAYKVIDVLITIPFMFAGLVLPWLTASWAENNIDQFKKYCQKSFDAMAVLAIPLIVGSQLIAKDVMVLIAGKDFAPSGAVLRILIIAAGTIFLGSVFTHGVIAINKQKKIISAYIFTGLTSVIGYIIFIPKFSYLGAAWVTIYSELTIVLVSAFLLWKHTKFIPKLSAVSKSILASAIMFFAIKNLSFAINSPVLETFIIILLAIIIYFILMFIFKGFNFFSFKQKKS